MGINWTWKTGGVVGLVKESLQERELYIKHNNSKKLINCPRTSCDFTKYCCFGFYKNLDSDGEKSDTSGLSDTSDDSDLYSLGQNLAIADGITDL